MAVEKPQANTPKHTHSEQVCGPRKQQTRAELGCGQTQDAGFCYVPDPLPVSRTVSSEQFPTTGKGLQGLRFLFPLALSWTTQRMIKRLRWIVKFDSSHEWGVVPMGTPGRGVRAKQSTITSASPGSTGRNVFFPFPRDHLSRLREPQA